MKKLALTIMTLAVAWTLFGVSFASVSYFTVSSVREQVLVSHERIKMVIDTYGAFFPYSGQVGWRILFSQYEIGDQDPQYQYAVWVLPAQSADLSQELWFVRPQGLNGQWHYRVDAVDANRATLATSREQVYTFSSNLDEVIYTGTIPYVAQDKYWNTSVGISNDTDKAATATLYFYTTEGNPYPVKNGGNSITVEIPAKGTWATYLGMTLPGEFFGHVEIESTSSLKWVAIFAYMANPVGMTYSGELK